MSGLYSNGLWQYGGCSQSLGLVMKLSELLSSSAAANGMTRSGVAELQV